MEQVKSLIIKEFNNMRIARGRDVVLFIGNTQTGKSTLINSLLGIDFKLKDDIVGFNLTPKIKKDTKIYAEMGEGISTTKLPKCYDCNINANNEKINPNEFNYVLVDTRGFFDLNENEKEYEMASSIMLDFIIKISRTVRVVFLERFNTIKEGITTFQHISSILGKIVKNENSPILIVLNRGLTNYSKSNISEKTKQTPLVIKELINKTKKQLEIDQKNLQQGEIEEDEYHETTKKLNFIKYFEKSLENKNYIYSDPLTNTNTLKQKIGQLQCLKKRPHQLPPKRLPKPNQRVPHSQPMHHASFKHNHKT